MKNPQNRVETILRNWRGQDDADAATAAQIAQEIDQAYREYLDSLPQNTAAILAGRQAHEARVA